MTLSKQNLKFAILAVDTALFTINNGELEVLLMPVVRPPHYTKNFWGLPGGLIKPHETAEVAATRHLKEKGGVDHKIYSEQLYTFSNPERDPRGRVVSVAYLGLAPHDELCKEFKKSNHNAKWFSLNKLPKLAFDHKKIIYVARERLKGKLTYTTIAHALLPKYFTLSDLQNIYDIILERKLDKRNFRKKILSLHLLKKTAKMRRDGAMRPAQLFQFIEERTRIKDILV